MTYVTLSELIESRGFYVKLNSTMLLTDIPQPTLTVLTAKLVP